jgi:flagellar basal body-associated protein FliL
MAKEGEKPAAAPEDDPKKAPAPAGSSSGMKMMLAIGLGMIVASGAVTFLTVKMTMPKEVVLEEGAAKEHKEGKEGKEGEKGGPSFTYDLREIYVNIAETKGTRILKIVPFLVLSEQRLVDEVKNLEPLLRDRVSYAASSMTIDQLEGPNGREALKREIMTVVNAALKEKMTGSVVDVYFSDFLIQ